MASKLTTFWVELNEDDQAIVTDGSKTSGAIEKVSKKTQVTDENGKTYTLGSFDAEKCIEKGYHDFAKGMKAGFPSNWKAIVRQQARNFDLMMKLADLQWRDLEAVGIEIAGMDAIYQDEWEFPNLKKALSPGGPLFGKKHALHAFLGAQPCYLNNNVFNVPYLCVVDCQQAPPDLLADHRLQQEREVFIPLRQLGMTWGPYLPTSVSGIGPEALPTEGRIRVLDWKRRPDNFMPLMLLKQIKDLCIMYPTQKDPEAMARAERLCSQLPNRLKPHGNKYLACMRKMKDLDVSGCKKAVNSLEDEEDGSILEQLHKWEYLVVYHIRPELFPTEPTVVTAVTFDFTFKNKDGSTQTVNLDFDKEIDRLTPFVEDFHEQHPNAEPLKDDGEELKQAVRDAFKAKRAREQASFDEKKETLEAFSDEQLTALKQMKVYKFYPNHPRIDVSPFVDPKVNLYLGKADVLEAPIADYKPEEHDDELVSRTSGRGRSKFATPIKPKRGRSPPSSASKFSPKTPASSKKAAATKKRPRSKSRGRSAKKARVPRKK